MIKLPEKNYNEAIKIYKQFIINNQIKSNSVIDLRIANRLILKNEERYVIQHYRFWYVFN